jgi:hypothetical protein
MAPGPGGLTRHGQVLRQQGGEEFAERCGVTGPFLFREGDIADAFIRQGLGPMGVAIGINQRGEEFRFEPGRFVLPIDLLQEADLPNGAGDFTQRRADSGCVMIEQWKKQISAR